MEVEDEVFTAHHRIKVETGDVFLDFLLLNGRRGLSHRLRLQLQRPFSLQKRCVDGQVHFVTRSGLVAIEE